MTQLTILRYPDPRLHTVAKPVAVVDKRLQTLVDDMLETMYAAEGIGLAATQVNVHERVIVIDVSEARDQPLVLINPTITWASDEKKIIYDGVERALAVKVEALGLDGKGHTHAADGLLSVCIQHEMDHLIGKVFVEYLSPLKRNRIKTKMIKQLKSD